MARAPPPAKAGGIREADLDEQPAPLTLNVLCCCRHFAGEGARATHYREAHLAMEIIADHGRMLSFEIVEVNPVIDEHNQTADLAVELALSAFGKKIL
ncbi:MAG TPA: arginase family protein [Terriglobales bacterium]|nr:arginase family protein [Terriglobales bacterium]